MTETFAIKNGKKLRCGYTTGSCAAAAAKGAAGMLLSKTAVPLVQLTTPKGVVLSLELEDIQIRPDSVSCAVRKDAGDDPDITDGVLVYASVRKTDAGIHLSGGEGIGTVTLPGLSCPVGAAAINPVPRRRIREAVQETAAQYGYGGGLDVVLSIPGGDVLAKKTFNPRLGIVGGLSVLGTSGIVEPMSEQALVDTIHLEMDARKAGGQRHILAFFGNYGVDFSRDRLRLDVRGRVTISNYVGEALDYAGYCGFADLLLIGHIGKVVKLAQGIMNTHSRYGDGRTAFLALSAVLAGADRETARQIYGSATTDEGLRIAQEHGLLAAVMTQVMEKVDEYMRHRAGPSLRTGVAAFSNIYGVLGYTPEARALLALHRRKETIE